jgi:hypothetical protein
VVYYLKILVSYLMFTMYIYRRREKGLTGGKDEDWEYKVIP